MEMVILMAIIGIIAALAMPNPSPLTSETLRAAAKRDGGIAQILPVVQLFQWLLPGLVANVAFFRAQLER